MSEEERRELNREMLVRIDERTKCLPQMHKDVGVLKTKVAKVEVKSSFYGTLGGFLAIAAWGIKDMIGKG